MAEMNLRDRARQIIVRHRGRGAQIGIYLGKMLRMFVYQNDWKVLPMAALIAGLVGMVVRRRLFLTMEGTLMGSFAMVMVCIWNGCFNSIQVVCRERDVIKREHRSGMHITSYIAAHMIYQALLCLAQTGVTLYITLLVGVKYPSEGLFTPWLIVDFGISMFLITFASDMMSLWVSCLARSTTTAMTIMPFVLIFQLVFSGGMLTLPPWTEPVTRFTISNAALKVLTTQGDYNNKPVLTIWNQVEKMKDKEVSATVTLGQVLELLQKEDNPTIAELRNTRIDRILSLGDVRDLLSASESYQAFREEHTLEAIGLEQLMTQNADIQVSREATLGELVDSLPALPEVQAHLDDSYTFKSTIGNLIDLIGEEKATDILQNKVAESNRLPVYDNTWENILGYWLDLFLFIFAFAALAIITLEFIDKDKR